MIHTLFRRHGDRVIASLDGETLWLEPVGSDAVRVRATMNASISQTQISAVAADASSGASVKVDAERAVIVNGLVRAELRLVPRGMGPALELSFRHAETGAVLLEEEIPHILWPGARHYTAQEGDLWATKVRFAAEDGERFYGLGQHQHGRFDQKGCVIDLLQMNTEVAIPFLVSSRGYGLIWNNPGVGRVELAENRTLWVMEATPQLDYVFIAGDAPADILQTYAALTGRPPMMPDWAMGFWQCKLRYETQDQVLEVAREYKRRDLPIDCLVIDFFHWTKMGEWQFNPDEFPDPGAMVTELKAMGITPMVSVWPTVNANADTFGDMLRAGYIVRSRRGAMDGSIFYDREPDGMNALHFYDATHPDARDFHWARVMEGYGRHGISAFWLDANEPEMYPMHPDNLRYHAGDGRAVTNAYPVLHQSGYAEAMAGEGMDDGILLSRSAWLGTQRHPVVVWSGDVKSTFADLARQIRAGLNMAMSGISWWTTDIGGFKGGDINDPAFRELMVRWFQYGAFCPVFRLHGFRQDAARDPRFGHEFSFGGADNEVWSFGEEAYGILSRYMHLRARIRPYIRAQMRTAHETGLPPMRPLLVDFQGDAACWDIADSFMFGPDLLVAPVLEPGARQRAVYLPEGAIWRDAWTGAVHAGGQSVMADAPLDRIPLFLRDGATLPIAQ
ncbi:MAG: glycoside hydrolase family 31 protein [Roseitalea sp.]|jgi:alpha-D-xyloside xylohydrolase|nr:glycoside hydrolase family 31 protein [Roseitalea sp.]MBO6720334.1 glycoside hydrolase family 31 protein [Roseitalea sp.]MBO6742694.1 glycoside hydrolase family 31 protein [Roseitalea sp.]